MTAGWSCRDSNGFEILCPDYFDDLGGDAGGHPDIDGSIAMAKGLWWLMANIGGVAVSPSPTPAVSPTATPMQTPTPTLQPTPIPPGGSVNIAPLGSAYRWWQNTSATTDANKFTAQGLNDNNLTVDVKLTTNGVDDTANAYEAAGVIWPTSQNIERVDFINGSFDANQNGIFSANIQMQTTTDGSTWTGTQWSITPTYLYDQASAANLTYTFVGQPLTNIRGVRIVGQVHTNLISGSWQAFIKEVLVYQSSSLTPTTAPTTPTPTPIPGDANADGKVDGIDYVIWLNHYGQSVVGVNNGNFNGDGVVDGIDYVIWLNNYGT